jgi:Uma2 family endonuclease
MAASTVVPLSEYLRTSYRPDRDWIDGEVRERNMGEGQHASVQKFLIRFLGDRETEYAIKIWPEQRVQTSETHYRVPDLCVCRGSAPFEQIVRTPPLLCIEILSWDDRMIEMQERVDDYLAMGVVMVWLVDPRRRKGFVVSALGQHSVEELTVPETAIRVVLNEVFAELDQLEGKV